MRSFDENEPTDETKKRLCFGVAQGISLDGISDDKNITGFL